MCCYSITFVAQIRVVSVSSHSKNMHVWPLLNFSNLLISSYDGDKWKDSVVQVTIDSSYTLSHFEIFVTFTFESSYLLNFSVKACKLWVPETAVSIKWLVLSPDVWYVEEYGFVIQYGAVIIQFVWCVL